MQAEREVTELTNELQKVEDELDAAESRLADITLQLEQAESTADENERYCRTLWPKIARMTTLLQQVLQVPQRHFKKPARLISTFKFSPTV